MSSYQAKDFKVGEPIDGNVASHIKQLQKVFGEQSSRSEYIELQSSIPWIKMQSGVILDAKAAVEYGTTSGNQLAKDNILFGLNSRAVITDENGNKDITYSPNTGGLPGYQKTSALGYRPKPGITSLGIRSHNRFGSLRTATISFQCWSKEQMDTIEVLYMRPGMTVLLEWGHSKVLKSSDKVEPSDYGIDYFTASDKMSKVISKIDSKRKTSNYSYDGIVGIIKNFSWKFRPDGGYDCQVSLVTAGDLIESYKASFYVEQSVLTQEYQSQVSSYQQNQASGSAATITFPYTAIDYDITSGSAALNGIPNLADTYTQFCGSVESTLSDLGGLFGEYINARAQGTAQEDPFIAAGFDTSTNSIEVLTNRVQDLIKSLKVVKGGDVIGTIQRYYSLGRVRQFGEEEKLNLTVDTAWSNGIVNFNVRENDLTAGTYEAGFISLLPMQNPYPTTPEFVKGIQDYQTNKSRDAVECIDAFFNLICKTPVTSGNTTTQLFENPVSVLNIPFTGGTRVLTEAEYKKAHQGRFYDPGRNSVISNYYELEEKSPGKIIDQNLNEVPELWKYDFESPSNSNTRERLNPYFVGPAFFFSVKYVGFQTMLAQQGSNAQVVNAGADDSYIDPNDDNLSKLHYHLRSKFDNPYVAAYLKDSFIGQQFTDVFKYRYLWDLVDGSTGTFKPSDRVKELFGSDETSERVANLMMYDSDPYFNTYEKQLLSWSYLLGGRFVSTNNEPVRNTVYIKLGALLELLNRHVLQSDSGYFFLFKSMYKNELSTPLYRTQDDHLSVNPEICILPNSLSKLNISRSATFVVDYQAPIILNIELGINFILDTLNKYIDDQGQVTILTFVQEVLDEISRVCGGINNLQLQYREDSSLFHVVDRNAVTPIAEAEYPELEVFGLSSIIKDINMVSKITPKMSSMIAISAQDTAFTSTQDATGFGALNRGITDRIFTDRYDEDRKEREDLTDYDSIRDRLIEDIVDLRTHILLYYRARTIPRIGKDTQVGVYQNYCNYLAGADSVYNHNKVPTYNFIIPFQVGLSLYGISGLQVMDAFRLSKDVLPKTYGGRSDSNIAFLITGIEHTINNGDWVTQLNTQIFNVDKKISGLYPSISFDIDRMPPGFDDLLNGEPKLDISTVNWTGSYPLTTLTRHPSTPNADNRPTQSILDALLLLDKNILIPITTLFGTIGITSAYRSPSVNSAIGGSTTSQHLRGEAVDFTSVGNGSSLATVFKWIAENLAFGQLIWEKGNDTNPHWIHVSFSSNRNAQELLRYDGSSYKDCDKFGKYV